MTGIMPKPAEPVLVCGWNGCTARGEVDYDDRCADHEWSQCSTEGCTGDADAGAGWNGYCGNCADRIYREECGDDEEESEQ